MTVIGDRPTEGAPDWKPAKRIVDRKAFANFYETATLACQICGGREGGLSIHHIVPRNPSQGGDDVHANFALLCGHGTAGHHGDVEHYRNGARSRLRERMTPEQLRYVLEKKGAAWLDRAYPVREQTNGADWGLHPDWVVTSDESEAE